MKKVFGIIIASFVLSFNIISVLAVEHISSNDVSSNQDISLADDTVISLDGQQNVNIDINGYNLYINGDFSANIKDTKADNDSNFVKIGYDENQNSIATSATINNSSHSNYGITYQTSNASDVTFNQAKIENLHNFGRATINSGNVVSSINQANINNHGTLIIENITADGNIGFLYNDAHNFTIKNNTISNGGCFFLTNDGGNMTIKDGTYGGLTAQANAVTTIEKGTFLLEDHYMGSNPHGNSVHNTASNEGLGFALISSEGGTLTIEDGTFDASVSTTYKIRKNIIYAQNSEVTIEKGTFSSDDGLFYLNQKAYVTVNDGTFNVAATDKAYATRYFDMHWGGDTGNMMINLNGGTFTFDRLNRQTPSDIFYIKVGTVNINGATLVFNELPEENNGEPVSNLIYTGDYQYSDIHTGFIFNSGSISINDEEKVNIYIQDDPLINLRGILRMNNGSLSAFKNDLNIYSRNNDNTLQEYLYLNGGTLHLKDREQPLKVKRGYYINYVDEQDGTVTATLLPLPNQLGDWYGENGLGIEDISWYRRYLAGVVEAEETYNGFDDQKKASLDLSEYQDGKVDILDLVQARMILAEQSQGE